MKKRVWFIFLSLLLLSPVLWAQQVEVSGRVTSEINDLPLANATVAVKGTPDAVKTDAEGNFIVRIPRLGTTLIVSYAGLETKEYRVESDNLINIRLKEKEEGLDEIVVVGYGTQKKSVVTGSISSVKAGDLEDMAVVRLEQALQGRTSGVSIVSNSGQPGDAATIRIRGTTTINGNEPLFIVDGMQIAGGIEYLNQNDIQSIEVLKDAASGAIYGARAANGVIIVTTKQGKKGEMRSNYNAYYGIQQPWRKQPMLDATQYATLMNEASAADGGGILFADPRKLGKGTNWQDELFSDRAPIQSHNLSMSGGGDKTTFFTSLGYLDQKGIVYPDKSKFKRITARFNAIHELNRFIKVGTNIGYTHINSQGVVGGTNNEFGSSLNRAMNIDPLTPVIETDPAVLGQPPYSNQPYIVRDAAGRAYGISPRVGQEIVNPIAVLDIQRGGNWSDKLVGNIYLEVEPVKGLKLKTAIATDLAFWGSDGYTPTYYLNSSVRVDSTNAFSKNKNNGLGYIWENTATYKRLFGDHEITVLAGMSAQENTNEMTGGILQNLPVDNYDEASLAWSGAVGPINQFYFGSEYEDKMASYFGRITYNFREKYLLTGILRADGSSRFGPENQFGYFPSISAGWVLSREDFWTSSVIGRRFNYFKIRASTGVNGNNQLPLFSFLSTIGSGARYYTLGDDQQLLSGSSPNNLSNPFLKWEEVRQTDIGFDAVAGPVNIAFSWFNKTTSGMLLQVDVPAYVGTAGPQDNVGKMSNKGVELELGYFKKMGDFDVDVSGNISFIKNEVTYLSNNKTFIVGQKYGPQGLEITHTSLGESYGYLYGFKTAGLFQNQAEVDNYINKEGDKMQPDAVPGDIRYVDVNGDGAISDMDRTKIGNAIPTTTFGISASLKWRQFDLAVFGQGVAGNKIFNITRRNDLPTANWSSDALGRWTGEGTSDYFPRLTNKDPNKNFTNSSEFFVQDGAYFRIRVLQVGYNFSEGLLNNVLMRRLRVYVSANNLFTFTPYRGNDPEITGGVDRGIYPQPRSFMAGVNLTF